MIRVSILIFLLTIFNYASLLDFTKISNAYNLYESKNYKESLREFKSLNKDTPEVNYNIANTLYKQGEYKKAIRYYKRAYGKGVNEANRIYNIANCYFNLKEWDSAIFAYKMALKIEDDKDIKYNLALAYKMKNLPKKESKKDKKKKKREGKGKKDKKSSGKDGKSSKKSSNKDRKLTKEELAKLKDLEQKSKFKKELKKMLNRSLKDKKVPVLMYLINDGNRSKNVQDIKPW